MVNDYCFRLRFNYKQFLAAKDSEKLPEDTCCPWPLFQFGSCDEAVCCEGGTKARFLCVINSKHVSRFLSLNHYRPKKTRVATVTGDEQIQRDMVSVFVFMYSLLD